jgi:DtxR family transcriptional regulator, Mn-dependent transcriptional regulator
VISDDVALRIAKMLGKPPFDPHGHPIPYGSKAAQPKALKTLTDLAPGAKAKVASLDDRDDDGVAALATVGILPGCALSVVSAAADRIVVQKGKKRIPLRRRYAALVRVAT